MGPQTDETPEQSTKPNGKHRWPRTLTLAAIAGGLLVVMVIWARVPWAWSPVDDAGHVLALNTVMEEQGTLGGIVAYSVEMFRIDQSWGLFRPSYWLYPSLFYLLPSTPAHVLRLAFLVLALAGPILYFRRQGVRGVRIWMLALLLLAAASSLYIGLFLVSLQELSAMAFIGLGLLLPNRWARLAMWTIAAWFKAPFAWLLIGQAVADWRRGERKLAIANAALGIGTLGLAVIMARGGSYTARYGFDPYAIWSNMQRLIEPMNALLLLSVVWWLAVTQSRMARTNDTITFGIGWAGYTAQLLPWGVTAYYMGPISFLFGLLLASTLGGARVPLKTGLVALIVPALVALVLVANPLIQGFGINGAVSTLQSCLTERSGSASLLQGSVIYVTTSEEAPIRLVQNLQLEDPTWTGSVALGVPTPEGSLPEGVQFLLNAGPRLDPVPRALAFICGNDWAQVYGDR